MFTQIAKKKNPVKTPIFQGQNCNFSTKILNMSLVMSKSLPFTDFVIGYISPKDTIRGFPKIQNFNKKLSLSFLVIIQISDSYVNNSQILRFKNGLGFCSKTLLACIWDVSISLIHSSNLHQSNDINTSLSSMKINQDDGFKHL